MKVLTQRVLSLVLLLTQAATFASPAFYVCISPKGSVCIKSILAECTCCLEEESADRGVVAPRQEGCADGADGCPCGHCQSETSAASPAMPGENPPGHWQGKPCGCTHIPLAVVQEASDVASTRATVVDPTPPLADFVPADYRRPFGYEGNSLRIDPLPHPPPSHLLSIACAVLRC